MDMKACAEPGRYVALDRMATARRRLQQERARVKQAMRLRQRKLTQLHGPGSVSPGPVGMYGRSAVGASAGGVGGGSSGYMQTGYRGYGGGPGGVASQPLDYSHYRSLLKSRWQTGSSSVERMSSAISNS